MKDLQQLFIAVEFDHLKAQAEWPPKICFLIIRQFRFFWGKQTD